MSAFKKKNHNAFTVSGPSPSLSSMQGALGKSGRRSHPDFLLVYTEVYPLEIINSKKT